MVERLGVELSRKLLYYFYHGHRRSFMKRWLLKEACGDLNYLDIQQLQIQIPPDQPITHPQSLPKFPSEIPRHIVCEVLAL